MAYAGRPQVAAMQERLGFTDLAAVSLDEPARILEKVFFTPKDFQDGTLYSFRD